MLAAYIVSIVVLFSMVLVICTVEWSFGFSIRNAAESGGSELRLTAFFRHPYRAQLV